MSTGVTSTFQAALETVEDLMPGDQEILIEIVRRRLIERRRAESAEDVGATREAYRHGDVRRGTADDWVAELAE